MRAALALLLLALSMLPAASPAQDSLAALLADRVEITAGGQLLASGNVEIVHQGARLTAAAITYDPATERLEITGPIRLSENGAEAVVLADAAALDPDLRNGILTSARLVLSEQLQLAAAQIRRVDGRYTELFRSVASSCQICAARPVPLWQIRARQIIHDQQTRRLYFRDARFEVAGVPLAYLPRLSMPDPTNTRARGVLTPRFSNSSLLGPRLAVPYFLPLGPHADVTVTPALSPRSRALELRYRRALGAGMLQFDGALARDDLAPGSTRAYGFVTGAFDLGGGYDLGVDLRAASDRTYLGDYGYFEGTRLPSTLSVSRTGAWEDFDAEITWLETLRGNEVAYGERLPSFLLRARLDRLADARPAGGTLRFGLELDGARRASGADVQGRDSLVATARADWTARRILGPGVELGLEAGAGLQAFAYGDDAARSAPGLAALPRLGANLRWPWVRHDGAASTRIEPVLRLGWADRLGDAPINQDGRLQELDLASLTLADPLAGQDITDTGLRAAGGLRLVHAAPSGLSFDLTLARVWQERPPTGQGAVSGLASDWSDWVIGGQIGWGAPLSASWQAQVDASGTPAKAWARAGWQDADRSVAVTYAWLAADARENRASDLSQISLASQASLARGWQGSLDASYDLSGGRPLKAGIGLGYRNECLRVDLSLSRRFTSSGNLRRDTSFGLEVSLLGFGSDGRKYRRSCAQFEG